jgi:hypothetical protein
LGHSLNFFGGVEPLSGGRSIGSYQSLFFVVAKKSDAHLSLLGHFSDTHCSHISS